MTVARESRHARRGEAGDWFLKDWMLASGVRQSTLARLTGWSAARTNDVYHGRTGYYREILNQAADALQVQPYELLMRPHEAIAIRQFVRAAREIAASDLLTSEEGPAAPMLPLELPPDR